MIQPLFCSAPRGLVPPLAWLAAICALGCSDDSINASGERLRNVDVTIVYPLPARDQLDVLWTPTDPGRGGPLLPAAVFDGGHVPELDELSPLADDVARLAALRVVAIRFDPCPGIVAPSPDVACKPDIRLVFQSLREENGAIVARDGAIHAFYELTPDEFQAVLDELRALRREQATAAEVKLGVHPRLAAEGLTGPFAQRLRSIVTAHAGAANLVRVTNFRRRSQSQSMWSFAMRERGTGGWTDSVVPTTTATEQGLNTIAGGRWDADLVPSVGHADDVTHLFKVSTPQEEKVAFRATVRVLNPRVHSSETIDCATCHIAPDVAVFARATRNLSIESYGDRFQTTYSLDAVSKSDDEAIGFSNVHMLSYLGTSLNVAPRTANETAVVLEQLNGAAR